MKEISCRRFISIKRYFDRSFSNPRPLKLSRLDVLLLSVLARTSNKVWAKVWGSAQNAFPGPISPKLSKKAAIFHTELDENLQTIITLQLIFTAPIFLFHFFFQSLTLRFVCLGNVLLRTSLKTKPPFEKHSLWWYKSFLLNITVTFHLCLCRNYDQSEICTRLHIYAKICHKTLENFREMSNFLVLLWQRFITYET